MKGLFKMIIFTKILFSLSLSLFIVYSTNKRIESSAFGSVFSFSCTLTFSFSCFFSFIIFFCFIVQGLKIVRARFLGQCVSEIPRFVLDPLAPLFTFRVLHLSKFFLLVNLLHLLFMEFQTIDVHSYYIRLRMSLVVLYLGYFFSFFLTKKNCLLLNSFIFS